MFKTDVRNKLDKIETLLLRKTREIEEKNEIIDILKEQLKESREQFLQLANRFMSRDFQEHQIYSTMPTGDSFSIPSPFSDEELVGEVIDGVEE